MIAKGAAPEEIQMEALAEWFLNWSDACAYAGECAPDLSSMGPKGCYAAIASMAAACFLAWWRNERALKRQQKNAARGRVAEEAPLGRGDSLNGALGAMARLDRALRGRRAAA
jgi:hypothetical protein